MWYDFDILPTVTLRHARFSIFSSCAKSTQPKTFLKPTVVWQLKALQLCYLDLPLEIKLGPTLRDYGQGLGS